MATKEFSKTEAIEMMNRCRQEILALRAELNILKPKAEAYDNIAIILRFLPRPSVGYGEDLVYIIERRLKELNDPEHPRKE